jgi:hypothetical protein
VVVYLDSTRALSLGHGSKQQRKEGTATLHSVLIFAASELDYQCRKAGLSNTPAAILSGMGGGIAQAYATMGFCTFMKTVEVTRTKGGDAAAKSTIQVAREIYAREGIRGINKV